MARRDRFVTPTTTKLPLSDGDWIEVKRRITYEEQEALNAASVKRESLAPGAGIQMDLATYNIERLAMWLVDWSFEDEAGAVVPCDRDAIKLLDPATAKEVDAALTAHIAGLEAERVDPTSATAPASS